jgi:hypothetical protein
MNRQQATGNRQQATGTRIACCLLPVACCLFSPAAGAQQPKPPPNAPPVKAPVPSPIRGSAIVRIATEVAQALGQVPAGAVVVASPITADVPVPKGDELAVRIAAQVAGKLGVANAHPQPVSLAVARGLSGKAASLVYVQIEMAKGDLRVTADHYPIVSNGWERLRNPAPGPKAHAFASSPIDAEIRTFLPPIVLEQASVHKAKHEETDVLAIGCGDVDADGGNELVLATRTKVVLGKLRGGKLTVVRSAPWTQLASRVPVPMREPIASIVVQPGEILVGTTDRGAVAVDATLLTRRQLTGLPIPGAGGEACAAASPEYGAFEGSGVACVPPPKGDPAAVLPAPTTRFDAIAALDLVGKDGATSQIVAAREPSGKLRLRKSDPGGKTAETPIEGVGSEVVLADLDLDGQPEIAFSGDSPDGDALTVFSWRPNGLVQRLKLPTNKESVRAVAACPPEERGLPALVAVVGSEVWLVR